MIRSIAILLACVSALAQNGNYPIVVTSTAQLATLNPNGMRAAVVSLTNGPIVFAYSATATDATNTSTTSPIIKPNNHGGRWFGKQIGAGAGGGSGDVVAANNLLDVANTNSARVNLGAAAQADLTTVSNSVVANTANIALKANQSDLTTVSNSVVANTASLATKLSASSNLSDVANPATARANIGAGDVSAASSFGTDNRLIRSDGTGKGVQSSGITIDDSNNISGAGNINAASITGTGPVASSAFDLPDDDGSAKLTVEANPTMSADATLRGMAAAFSGLIWVDNSSGVMTMRQSVAGTDHVVPGGAIGAATATTPSAGDNDTSVPTTAWTQTEIDATQTGTHASPSTSNPLAPTWSGPVHNVWYGATGEIDLPAAAGYVGRCILIYNTGAFTITVDPNASEVIVRDGTVQTGGVTFTLSSGAGNYVALLSDGTRWITLGYKGTLAVGS